jgi:threonyl-tRNA synthetase
VKVLLPDGKELSLQDGASGLDLAAALGGRWPKRAVAVEAGGRMLDLGAPLPDGAAVRLVAEGSAEGRDLLRHSAAHVMAAALKRVVPGVRLAIGPAVENGFYYDVAAPRRITQEDFPAIEKEMAALIAADAPFVRSERPREEALAEAERSGDKFKAEMIRELPAGETISFYRCGDFEDLCRGPHLPSAGRVGAVKLLSVAGAYWRGDASREQLQRVYGTAFEEAGELEKHLAFLEEAKKRDHRFLARQHDLYSTDDEIGPGLILWHPRLAAVRRTIEDFWWSEHTARGYWPVYTPHIASEQVYRTSGHLENYADMMYSPMDIDDAPYRVKPMNCPGHIKIYQTARRSYRELPLRYAELGTVYRYEPSGTLHGMLRVRGFTQDDAHIFCTPEQLAGEIEGVLDLVDTLMKAFGYSYKTFLSTMPEKHLGSEAEWDRATASLRQALERRGQPYEVDAGGGCFYAPKIDLKLLDSLGREWQGPTIQVDLNLPKRFKVEYVGADNATHEAVMVHRAVLGSMERFVGGLIEHYGAAWPTWLAPVQVTVAPIAERHHEGARRVIAGLRSAGVRVGEDLRNEKLGLKVREWTISKVPYLAVMGDKELEEGSVALRVRGAGQGQEKMSVSGLAARILGEVRDRSIGP